MIKPVQIISARAFWELLRDPKTLVLGQCKAVRGGQVYVTREPPKPEWIVESITRAVKALGVEDEFGA